VAGERTGLAEVTRVEDLASVGFVKFKPHRATSGLRSLDPPLVAFGHEVQSAFPGDKVEPAAIKADCEFVNRMVAVPLLREEELRIVERIPGEDLVLLELAVVVQLQLLLAFLVAEHLSEDLRALSLVIRHLSECL
jgi:hypothetical protein